MQHNGEIFTFQVRSVYQPASLLSRTDTDETRRWTHRIGIKFLFSALITDEVTLRVCVACERATIELDATPCRGIRDARLESAPLVAGRQRCGAGDVARLSNCPRRERDGRIDLPVLPACRINMK